MANEENYDIQEVQEPESSTPAQTRIATETDRFPLETEGLELLSDEGLNELRQQVEQEILRRRGLDT